MAVLKRKPLILPTKKSEIPTSISQYSVFIYGQQKIGKTSLTSKFPKALHFFFEPSGTDYELFEVAPKNWDEFLQYISLLEKQEEAGELQFETFILDVVDLAYEMCLKHHSGLQGLDYPPKNDFGQTWKEIKDGFRAALIRLARIGGIVCVSHHKEVVIETRGGIEYSMMKPSAPNGCVDVLSKWADLTAYYRVAEGGGRELCITPSDEYEAGNRMESRFKYKKTKTQVTAIPMGESSDESFENFMLAFNNELLAPKIVDSAENKPKIKLKAKGTK
tara:strand:- start:876 stop:1703 length:828 start_codon:yes stop_codon:yes gene_type:complete